jgi:hypothetical protein
MNTYILLSQVLSQLLFFGSGIGLICATYLAFRHHLAFLELSRDVSFEVTATHLGFAGCETPDWKQ